MIKRLYGIEKFHRLLVHSQKGMVIMCGGHVKEHILISIIIPVYNSEKYLSQCIDSVLDQTFSDFELLLIDDGSQDKSGEICDLYMGKDRRVRAVHQKNAGVSMARNRGIDEAQGQYIMFIDSDDHVEPILLEKAYRSVRDSNADLYVCGCVIDFYEEGKIVSSSLCTASSKKFCHVTEFLEGIETMYPYLYILTPCCKLYSKRYIEMYSIRFQQGLNLSEDALFNQKIFSKIQTVSFSDEILYHYRKEHKESLTARFCPDYYEATTYVHDKMRELLNRSGCDERAKQRFEGAYFSLLVGGITNWFIHLGSTTAQERKDMLDKIALNPYVRKLSVKYIGTFKKKIIFLFLQLRLTSLLAVLLEKYYQKR